MSYRVVVGPYYRPSDYATAHRYAELADALRVMGEGMVIAEDGHIAAFHERHEAYLVRKAEEVTA